MHVIVAVQGQSLFFHSGRSNTDAAMVPLHVWLLLSYTGVSRLALDITCTWVEPNAWCHAMRSTSYIIIGIQNDPVQAVRSLSDPPSTWGAWVAWHRDYGMHFKRISVIELGWHFGTLYDIIIHEADHTIGFNSMWYCIRMGELSVLCMANGYYTAYSALIPWAIIVFAKLSD